MSQPTYYQTIIDLLSPPEKANWNKVLTMWQSCTTWPPVYSFSTANHIKLTTNIKNEHFLRRPRFRKILQTLAGMHDQGIVDILLRGTQEIYKSYLLQGKRIPTMHQPSYFATVMPLQTFQNRLFEQYVWPQQQIEEIFDKPLISYVSSEKQVKLKDSDFLIWMTWDEYNKDDPYSFLERITLENIRKAMALDDKYQGRQFAVFYFKRKEEVRLYRPTWCDAHMSDKFSPTDPNLESRWGLTDPWEAYDCRPTYGVRRPEGVIRSHSVDLSMLYKPIQKLLI